MPDLSNLVIICLPAAVTTKSTPNHHDFTSSKELQNPPLPFLAPHGTNGQTCGTVSNLTTSDHLTASNNNNDKLGFPKQKKKPFFPFLVGSPKLAECLVCDNVIYPGEEIPCNVRDCKGSYHLACAIHWLGYSRSSKAFKCPQHACYLCKKSYHLWRCTRCHLASHDKCAAFPEYVLHSKDHPWKKTCWRHTIDWPPLKPAVPASSIEELFCRLPLPYKVKEFTLDVTLKDPALKDPPLKDSVLEDPVLKDTVLKDAVLKDKVLKDKVLKDPVLKDSVLKDPVLKDLVDNKLEPPPYVHIRRNIYLVKKKRDDTDRSTGCIGCSSSTCSEDCVCRQQCISCSKACRCSETCTNKPFRKDKKVKIVLTKHCGWGVEAAEDIKKGEFIIEYVGEVISDVLCTQRLWEMKYQGIKNFYMCEIRKDFTIDATLKGNAARFLNHSCGPNCTLEKWDVDGETRVGVFAARSIKVGEPLTYDYRFVLFGAEVKCECGASCCQGYLGSRKKTDRIRSAGFSPKLGMLDWGVKRRRTTTSCLRIIRP